MTEHAPVLLSADADPDPELVDHPLEVTEDEARAGLAMWQAVDDLDDESTGMDQPRAASPGYAEALRRAKIVKRCLLEAGVPEVSIELLNGRPTSGDSWNACRPVTVFSHHIASKPTPANPTPGLSLVKRGRSDLPGPLANGTAGVDLVYRIICMGMANHPGTGGPLTVRGPMGTFTIPRDVARPYAWGTEFEGGFTDAVWDRVYTNRRTGKSMTFREFMGRVNSGLTRAIWLINGHGRNPGEAGQHDLSGYHGEHKTWAPGRKPDRLHYTTSTGRAEIRKYTEKPEDDVSAKDVWDYKIAQVEEGKKPVKARNAVSRAYYHAREAHAQADRNAAAINALAASLAPHLAAEIKGLVGESAPIDLPDLDIDDDPQEDGTS